MEITDKAPVGSKDLTKFKHSTQDELFNLVKDPKTGKVIICIGQNKVSKKQFKTFKQADEYIRMRPYELLVNVSVLIYKTLEQNEKENNAPKNGADTESN